MHVFFLLRQIYDLIILKQIEIYMFLTTPL